MTDDIQRQWRELEENYSHMADEELESLASQAYELTDIAKQALRQQITTRSLQLTLNTNPPPADEPEDEPRGDFNPAELPLVNCIKVWSAEEALAVLDGLHKASIPAYLGPNLVEKVQDFHGNFEKGAGVMVREADEQRAYAALSKVSMPGSDESDDDSENDALPSCPKCGSEEIVFLDLDHSAVSDGEGEKFRWHCDACGHDWEDNGIAEN